jgi:hypothetical protein
MGIQSLAIERCDLPPPGCSAHDRQTAQTFLVAALIRGDRGSVSLLSRMFRSDPEPFNTFVF